MNLNWLCTIFFYILIDFSTQILFDISLFDTIYTGHDKQFYHMNFTVVNEMYNKYFFNFV